MARVELSELLEAGSHFGHITRRWNPKMKPFIFTQKNGIHILDLRKTQDLIDVACDEITQLTSQGKRVLFVGTKKQAKKIFQTEAMRCNEHYVTHRWLGGLLTNFVTIRKSVKRYSNIVKMETDGTFDKITKKEKLQLMREKLKLDNTLSGVVDMTKLPGALFIVDIKKEAIAVREARRLGIPVFAFVDTNTDPTEIDFPIPANDDATKSIQLIAETISDAVIEGKEVASANAIKNAAETVNEEDEKESREKREAKDSTDDMQKPKRKRVAERGKTSNKR
ncbi:MAG: 30S ribosomal protein S2 [Bacteroidota bacterium]